MLNKIKEMFDKNRELKKISWITALCLSMMIALLLTKGLIGLTILTVLGLTALFKNTIKY